MLDWLREFFKTTEIALKRSGRDRRARLLLILRGIPIVYWALVIGGFVYVILHSNGRVVSAAAYLIFCAGAGTILALLRRAHRRDNDLLNFSITGQTESNPIAPTVEEYLAERMVILASLLARAASEAQLRRHPAPEGVVPVMRQRQNALLRERGLWEKLEPAEEALAAAADGQWAMEQLTRVEAWCEQLRLLRWVFGLDSILTPLAHFPRSTSAVTHGLLEPHGSSFHVKPGFKPGALLMERDIARQYVARTFAEFQGRGLTGGFAQIGEASRLRAAVKGPSTDFLAGAHAVGELDNASLGVLAMVAFTRAQYAEYLAQQLAADRPSPFSAPSAPVGTTPTG